MRTPVCAPAVVCRASVQNTFIIVVIVLIYYVVTVKPVVCDYPKNDWPITSTDKTKKQPTVKNKGNNNLQSKTKQEQPTVKNKTTTTYNQKQNKQ